jgi:purine-nucleoside phosphorylase
MKSAATLGFAEAERAARFLKRRCAAEPRVGIVLGSGLGSLARCLRPAVRIPWRAVPHFPLPTAEGHAGIVHAGEWRGTPVAILEGRLHLYEGWRPDEVAFPVRALARAGVRYFILTAAAGGIAPRALPGRLMIFSDHLNFQGANVLAGPHEPSKTLSGVEGRSKTLIPRARDEGWGRRFVDFSEAYDRKLRALARQSARRAGIRWFEGVYAAVLGPSYETPAEIRALARLGADAVGMSTVPEVLALGALGLTVLAVATITNRAAGLEKRPLTHEEVLRAGRESARDLGRWLDDLLPRVARAVAG